MGKNKQEEEEDSKFPGCQIKMEEKRREGAGQVRDEKASEGSFLLIFGFLFPLPFVDVVVTHPAPYSPSLSLSRPPPCFWLYGLYLASLLACSPPL